MFEPYQRLCVVSLSSTLCLVLVQPRKTHPDMTEKLLNQNKQTVFIGRIRVIRMGQWYVFFKIMIRAESPLLVIPF